MVMLAGLALIELIIGSTILPALIYGRIVILYLSVRKRLQHKQGGFSLGRALNCRWPSDGQQSSIS